MKSGIPVSWRLKAPHPTVGDDVEAALALDSATLSCGPCSFDFAKERSESGELTLTLTRNGDVDSSEDPVVLRPRRHEQVVPRVPTHLQAASRRELESRYALAFGRTLFDDVARLVELEVAANGDSQGPGAPPPTIDMGDSGSSAGFNIVSERPAPKAVVLRVTGEVDLWTSFTLMESLIAAQSEHPDLIAVDLSDVPLMDDAGLRTLEEGARDLADGGVHFAVVSPPGHELAHLPQLAGLHRVLNVHESVKDALGPRLDETGE
jgi:anti-anti-sigma factor